MDNHYTVLGLSHRQHDQTLTEQDLKKAYRQALLKHHPDKLDSNKKSNDSSINSQAKYTVDQITTALSVLSDATSRAEYDQSLRQQQRERDNVKFFTGLDTVDLDDLDYDDTEEIWYRSCRCGDGRGFIVTEADLERAAGNGELVVGCKGCSLWMKVLFQVAADS